MERRAVSDPEQQRESEDGDIDIEAAANPEEKDQELGDQEQVELPQISNQWPQHLAVSQSISAR